MSAQVSSLLGSGTDSCWDRAGSAADRHSAGGGGGEGMDPSSFNEQLPPFGLDEFEKRSVWKRAAEVQLAW